MCGIAGSFNRDKGFELYTKNLSRGFYSSGCTRIYPLGYSTDKVPGIFYFPTGTEADDTLFLYHSRGPTGDVREYRDIDNHPFESEHWIIAHNGIITNYKELYRKYLPDHSTEGVTDSSIIPYVLDNNDICTALEELRGTFSLWMYNKNTGLALLTRCGCTLYANSTTGDFSSSSFEGGVQLKEGVIYSINTYNRKIEEELHYRYDSPYFVI